MRRALTALTLSCGLLVVARPFGQYPPAPTFRTAADLVVVDVQVIDANGAPIPTLTKDDFRVSIDRRRRTVQSAEFLSYATTAPSAGQMPASGSEGVPASLAPSSTGSAGPSTGRTLVIAVDLLTFDVGASRGIAAAARQFIEQLSPLDRVGLFPYPLGPRVPPTTSHAATLAALDQLAGQKLQSTGRYAIGSGDIVDWWAGDSSRIIARECGGGTAVRGDGPPPPVSGSCATDLGLEIAGRTQEYEAQAHITNAQLKQLFELLTPEPGRKFVMLMSGGIPMSDRPGGRPDAGTAALDLGTLAARGNIGLYALYLDSSFLGRFSASVRTVSRAPATAERNSTVEGLWLGQIATASGGALMRVLVGTGEASLTRVLRETSAYYLLGVEPGPSDGDGRPHAIEVSVAPRGLTVRSRRWVVMNTGR